MAVGAVEGAGLSGEGGGCWRYLIRHRAVVSNLMAKSRRRTESMPATLPSKTRALVSPKRAFDSGDVPFDFAQGRLY
jgi:hypothetical protein